MMKTLNSGAQTGDAQAADRALFDELDLDRPALASVKRAFEAGDLGAAKHELAQYYRQRTSVPWKIDPRADPKSIKWNPDDAQDAVDANLYGGLVKLKYQFPHGDIDWHYNATDHVDGVPHNNEWTWQINRMSWWGTLGDAYGATRDEKYARAWVKQLRSWAAQNPLPDKSERGAGTAWRGIEAGIRMHGAWPNAFYRFTISPSFTDDDIALYLRVMHEHGTYLRRFQSGGNHLTMEMSGLYSVGALFPEFKAAREWRQFAADRMEQEIGTQILPDGAQFELSSGYHFVALDNMLAIPNIAQITGNLAELPPTYIDGTENAYNYALTLMTPNRRLPAFNDSWDPNVQSALRKASDLFPRREDFAWVVSDGKAGAPPQGTSHAFDWAGYYAMRSDWSREANYLVLDAGPLGMGHQHQDKLNVVAWAYGRELLFDSGGASYEKSVWRDYSIDTFSHNCVLVDGLPQRRPVGGSDAEKMRNPEIVSQSPIDARWQSNAEWDFAAGVYGAGWGKPGNRIVTQTRRVLFVKPDLFIVADTLVPTDGASHEYQARWNLLPAQTTFDKTTLAVTTVTPDAPNLAVVPLLRDGLSVRTISAQETPELLGWDIHKDSTPEHIPATTVTHTRSGTGVQQFLTLLLPLRAGQTNPIQSARATGETGAEVIFADGRRLQISADADPSRGITVEQSDAQGAATRVRAGENSQI